MNVRIEELPLCRIKVGLQFDAAEVSGAFAKVYKDLSTRGQIPGFRPGKAPKALLIRFFGPDTIRTSAAYELLQDNLEEAIKDLDILGEPEMPDLEKLELAEGEPIEIELVGSTSPRVQLGESAGLQLVSPPSAASEEEIAHVLSELQEANATESETERTVVQQGDLVDLALSVVLGGDEEVTEDWQTQLIVGKGDTFPPVDEQLVGKSIGESVELDTTFPDDYEDGELAGQDAHVVATVEAIRERQLPALDDDFARLVDAEQFATLDALQSEITRQITERNAAKAREELETQIVDALLETSEIQVPAVMVSEMAARDTRGLLKDLGAAGMSLEQFQSAAGMDGGAFEQMQIARAYNTVTIHALLDKLAESVEVTDEQARAELEAYAVELGFATDTLDQQMTMQPELAEQLTDQSLERLKRRLAFDAIIAQATVTELPEEEYEQAREEQRLAAQARRDERAKAAAAAEAEGAEAEAAEAEAAETEAAQTEAAETEAAETEAADAAPAEEPVEAPEEEAAQEPEETEPTQEDAPEEA